MIRLIARHLLLAVLALLAVLPLSLGLVSGAAPAQADGSIGDGTVLLGGHSIEPNQDRLLGGRAEAWRLRARTSGLAGVIGVYVDAGSRARAIDLGVYGNAGGHPGSLLGSGSVSLPRERRWSLVALSPIPLVRGQVYWLAVLGRGGTLRYRGGERGPCTSDRSASPSLLRLPVGWQGGGRAARAGCSISGYVAAVGPQGPAEPSPASTPSSSQPTSQASPPGLPVPSEQAPPGSSSSSTAQQPTQEETQHEEAPQEERHEKLPEEESSPPAPKSIAPPVIGGSAIVGERLEASSGEWSGDPVSYEYQWQDCNALGEACLAIGGAGASSYTLTPGDFDSTVSVVVTATNAGGSTSSPSAVTAVVRKSKAEERKEKQEERENKRKSEEEKKEKEKEEKEVKKEEKTEEKKEEKQEEKGAETSTDCFENPETEGTARIERCGYPGQKNVGVEDCEALAKSGPKTITKAETVENVDIAGQVVIEASGVTLNHDCVIHAGEDAVKLEGLAASLTISNSTIRGENATTGRVATALASEYSDTGVATKDRLEYCEECVNGWKWTVKESFVFANGELKNPAIHREDWFDNRGWVIADDDTMLNPETQTAIVFSEDNGVPCENEMAIENSLFAGSGYMFQNCAHASGSGPGKFVFKGNRIARCTGKLVHGEGNYCEGPDRESPESGFDANGYFPDGGYFGIYGTCEACTSAGLAWEDNYWDNNLEAVAKP